MQVTLYKTVAEVKEDYPNGYFSTLGEPQGVAFVAVVYKWSYNGNSGLPDFPFVGPFQCAEVHNAEKWDAFIFCTAADHRKRFDYMPDEVYYGGSERPRIQADD